MIPVLLSPLYGGRLNPPITFYATLNQRLN